MQPIIGRAHRARDQASSGDVALLLAPDLQHAVQLPRKIIARSKVV